MSTPQKGKEHRVTKQPQKTPQSGTPKSLELAQKAVAPTLQNDRAPEKRQRTATPVPSSSTGALSLPIPQRVKNPPHRDASPMSNSPASGATQLQPRGGAPQAPSGGSFLNMGNNIYQLQMGAPHLENEYVCVTRALALNIFTNAPPNPASEYVFVSRALTQSVVNNVPAS